MPDIFEVQVGRMGLLLPPHTGDFQPRRSMEN